MTEGVGMSLSAGGLASLWGIDQDAMEEGVMRRTVTAGDTTAHVALNAAQVRPFSGIVFQGRGAGTYG